MKMLPSVLTLWLLTTSIGSAAPQPPDEKEDKAKEAKKLQGTWNIVSAEFSGKRREVKDIGIDRIIVSGEKMTLKNGNQRWRPTRSSCTRITSRRACSGRRRPRGG